MMFILNLQFGDADKAESAEITADLIETGFLEDDMSIARRSRKGDQ